jgi:hypothetical protein
MSVYVTWEGKENPIGQANEFRELIMQRESGSE